VAELQWYKEPPSDVMSASDRLGHRYRTPNIDIVMGACHSLPPSTYLHVALVGDSDIAGWPDTLLPSIKDATVSTKGYNGATLGQTVKRAGASLSKTLSKNEGGLIFLVVCAGENDIYEVSLRKSERAFERLLEITFNRPAPEKIHLVFLGPKFEPWLEDDPDARKQYIQMSLAFARCCKDHPMSQSISFIDCLTMFCGESGQQPGAVLGGKAVAEQRYFQSDQLHLSNDGYQIWKKVVEDCILRVVTSET
jgi:lysophospholipase L1-like esterase